jgi:hypothetical protein
MIATANSMVNTLPMVRGESSSVEDSPAIHKVNGKNGSAGARSQGTGARGQETDAAPAQRAKTRQRKPWKPQANDHLIYQWVRFEGKSQVWVAQQLEISQPTVSRTLQRYERWQARAEPREGGRLDHAERLRAQRWLTYERNERILASCLRMAGDMEGFIDVSQSTIRRDGIAGEGNEIRTVHSTLDRSGIASRFLRLAFRINMEQLKLTEQEPLEPLPPLSEGELEEIELEEQEPGTREQETGDRDQETGNRSTSGPAIVSTVELDREQEDEDEGEGVVLQDESPVEVVHHRAYAASEVNLNKVHNCIAAENVASDDSDGTCATNRAEEKIRGTCMNSTRRRRPKRAGRDAECPTQDPHPGSLVNEVGAFCDTVADGREGALP